MDQFVKFGVDYVRNDFGSCRPLYDIYDAITITACDNLIGTLNGIWTSLGLSLFFLLPAMVIAHCLIGQFRKVEPEDVDDPSAFVMAPLLRGAKKII